MLWTFEFSTEGFTYDQCIPILNPRCKTLMRIILTALGIQLVKEIMFFVPSYTITKLINGFDRVKNRHEKNYVHGDCLFESIHSSF